MIETLLEGQLMHGSIAWQLFKSIFAIGAFILGLYIITKIAS